MIGRQRRHNPLKLRPAQPTPEEDERGSEKWSRYVMAWDTLTVRSSDGKRRAVSDAGLAERARSRRVSGDQRRWRGWLVAGAMVAVFFVPWQGTKLGYWLAASVGLRVEQFTFAGLNRLTMNEVISVLDIAKGKPILAVDVVEATRRLQNMPGVVGASVRRELPSTIQIRIEEARPIALWKRGTVSVPIDRFGRELPMDTAIPTIPVIVGRVDAPKRIASLLQQLSVAPALRAQIASAELIGGRRWNVGLRNGPVVMLPEEGTQFAWKRVAALLQNRRLPREAGQYIDLRLADRITISPANKK